MEPAATRDPLLGTSEVRRRHIVPKAIAVGVVAGVVGAGFRLTLQWAEEGRDRLLPHLTGAVGLLLAVALGALGGGLAVFLVRRYAPHARGSGIPQVKAVLEGQAAPEWRRMIPVKFVSGLVAIGSGFALGREGPTIQIGSGVGSMLSEWFHVEAGGGERRALVSAGAGAGLAAAFNAPLSGLVFVLEEIHGTFTPVLFVAAFLASVSSDIMTRLLSGSVPVFHLPAMTPPTTASLPWAGVLGAIIGVAGVLFNRGVLAATELRMRLPRVPPFALGAVVGCFVGVVAWLVPGLVGSGAPLLQRAFAGRIAVAALPLYVLARYALTSLSYGSGAAGGIFAPLLVIGALTGLWFGAGVHALLPVASLSPTIFCVVGMGAMFTAVVRAPLTGIVLMIELTGMYEFMLPLLVACLAAYGVAEGLGNQPIYRALQDQARRAAATEPAPARLEAPPPYPALPRPTPPADPVRSSPPAGTPDRDAPA